MPTLKTFKSKASSKKTAGEVKYSVTIPKHYLCCCPKCSEMYISIPDASKPDGVELIKLTDILEKGLPDKKKKGKCK